MRRVVSELDLAVKLAGRAGRRASGTLKIGMMSSLASMFLRKLIVEYARENPAIQVEIAEGAPREHIVQIKERQLDVAFATGEPTEPACDAVTLWAERVFVAIPKNHRLYEFSAIDWDRLKNEQFIVSQEPGPEIHDYLIRKLATLGHHPSVVRYKVGRENLINLVGMGFGLTLTSESTIMSTYPNVAFKPLD